MATRMRIDHIAVGATATLLSVSYLYTIWSKPFQACAIGGGEEYERAIEFLDGVIELGLTLGTGIVGLGAALLIGTYGSLRLTPYTIVIVFLAILATCQSVAYGIWWKFGVANLWFNNCLENIASEYLQTRYAAHFQFLIIGIVLLGLMVGWVAVSRLNENNSGVEK